MSTSQRPMRYDVSPFIDLPSPLILNWLNTVLAWCILVVYFCGNKIHNIFRRSHNALWHLYYLNVTPQTIRKELSVLPKIPTHVCFILNLEALNGMPQLLKACSDVSSWCIGAGSSQVTLYESTGCLKRETLDSVANAIVSGLVFHFGRDNVPTVEFRKGEEYLTIGNDDEPVLSITLMEEQDGRPFLANLAKEFSQKVSENTLNSDDITVPFIHDIVTRKIGDEPDLIITFGSNLDIEGFSPWLVRVSELYHLPGNHGFVSYYVFKCAMFNFANVKINLGS